MSAWFQRTVSGQLWLFNISRICSELDGVCKITQEMCAEIVFVHRFLGLFLVTQFKSKIS